MSTLHPCVAAAVVVSGLLSSLPAQNLNMTLLKQWDRSSSIGYNDVWGWTAPDGREFAYVGETRGIWIVEVTDPSNPKQIVWYSAPSSTWRDFTNVGQYVYVATENRTQRGFRVIDMSNPSSPQDFGYVQTSTMISAHNVSADPDTGKIYFSGSRLSRSPYQGVAIYDTRTNPTNPGLVGTLSSPYTHDLCVRRGRGYFAMGQSYQVRILNVTNSASLPEIGRCNTPGGYAHNAWISEDDKLLVATDEISRSGVTPHMTVWDVSNPSSPSKVGDYDNGSAFIVHNAFVTGRTAVMSHYVDGIHVVDLADPTRPTRIGKWDTSSVSRGYSGCWGCFPFLDSGVILGSDMQNGLFILRQNCGWMNRYGKGTAGTKGVPRARFDGASPKVNAPKLRFEIENLEPNKNFWIAVSTGTGTGTVLGANLNVNLNSGTIVGPIQANGNGEATVNAPVPNNTALGNVRIYFQFFGDRGNGTLVSSRGMWAGICR